MRRVFKFFIYSVWLYGSTFISSMDAAANGETPRTPLPYGINAKLPQNIRLDDSARENLLELFYRAKK